MGNYGRQAWTGTGLASLHLRPSSEGTSNVEIARTDRSRTGEGAGDTRSMSSPIAYTVRYVTPKKRGPRPAPCGAKTSLDSPHSSTPPSSDRLWDRHRGHVDDEPLQKSASGIVRGGPDDLYDTSGDEGEAPRTSLKQDNAARAEVPTSTLQIRDGSKNPIGREQDHAQSKRIANDLSRLDGTGVKTPGRRISSVLNFEARFAQRDDLDGACELRMECASKSVRIPRLIRLRRRSTESDHARPSYPTAVSDSRHPSQSFFKHRPGHLNLGERPSAVGAEVGGDQIAPQIETTAEVASTNINTASSEASPTFKHAVDDSRIRAPSVSFKAKKGRGKFDAGAIEARFGIRLSPKRAERPRALSGNDRGAPINLFLPGYCDVSKGQGADVSSPAKEQDSGLQKRRSSSGSVSCIEFWRQRRQSEKQTQSSYPEATRGSSGQNTTSSEDRNLMTDLSDQGSAQRNREDVAPLLSMSDTSEVATAFPLPQYDPGQLIQHEPCSEKGLPGNMDWRRHYKDGILSRQDAQVADAKRSLVNASGVANDISPEIIQANDKSVTTGAGPVPLRGMQAFPNQENVRPRNPPSSTGRLPNGKLGACQEHL